MATANDDNVICIGMHHSCAANIRKRGGKYKRVSMFDEVAKRTYLQYYCYINIYMYKEEYLNTVVIRTALLCGEQLIPYDKQSFIDIKTQWIKRENRVLRVVKICG